MNGAALFFTTYKYTHFSYPSSAQVRVKKIFPSKAGSSGNFLRVNKERATNAQYMEE